MTATRILRPTTAFITSRPFVSSSRRFVQLRHGYSTHTNSTSKPDGKLKTFMKKYGYVGVGVYLGFSVVDLGLTMGLIHVKGAEKVEQLEHWVLSRVTTGLGMEAPPRKEAASQQPSWTSIFVLAYGIHKTILLPFRLSLTAAVTPAVARKLASLGWIKRRSVPKAAR
jgi:hypothetical protein